MTQDKKAAQRGSVALLSLSMAAMLAMPAAAATTYTVTNTALDSTDNAEQVDITQVGSNYYGLVVGGNTNERVIRSVALQGDPTVKQYNFDSVFTTSPGNTYGYTKAVAVDIAAHPTQNYAIAAIGDQDTKKDLRGTLLFVQVDGTGTVIRHPSNKLIRMGSASIDPESIEIAPNGLYAIVANKAEGYGVGATGTVSYTNKVGSLSLINLAGGPASASEVKQTTLTVPNEETNLSSTRKFEDPAPEAIAISADSSRAFVTLGENNALAIVDINSTNLGSSITKVVGLPRFVIREPGKNDVYVRLLPEGIATFKGEDGTEYIVTANRGVGTERADSVSLLRVARADDGTYTVRLVADSGKAIADRIAQLGFVSNANSKSEPRSIVLEEVNGQLKAYVTLYGSHAVAIFNVDAAGTDKLVLEDIIPLDRNQASGPNSIQPLGLDVALPFDNAPTIVTANRSTTNVSIIRGDAGDPTVAFAVDTADVLENAGTFNLTVRLSGSTSKPVTVNYAVTGGSAIAGQDYTLANGSVTFAPGEVTKVVPVTIADNAVSNNPRTVEVTLSAPTNATLDVPTRTILTIIDDESASVGFVVEGVTVNENAGTATAQIRRIGGAGQEVTVRVSTANGTATAGDDYTALNQVVTFGAGETLKSVQVAIIDDTAEEANETFTINLSEPSGTAQLLDPKVLTVTITGNDVVVTPPDPAPTDQIVFLPYVAR